MTSHPVPRLRRCCTAHESWLTLSRHLIGDFAAIAEADVLRELTDARRAVEAVGLQPPDDIYIAELIARNQLLLLSGDLPDAARLDPQTHVRTSVRTTRASGY